MKKAMCVNALGERCKIFVKGKALSLSGLCVVLLLQSRGKVQKRTSHSFHNNDIPPKMNMGFGSIDEWTKSEWRRRNEEGGVNMGTEKLLSRLIASYVS